jgi:hypothetical protein
MGHVARHADVEQTDRDAVDAYPEEEEEYINDKPL